MRAVLFLFLLCGTIAHAARHARDTVSTVSATGKQRKAHMKAPEIVRTFYTAENKLAFQLLTHVTGDTGVLMTDIPAELELADATARNRGACTADARYKTSKWCSQRWTLVERAPDSDGVHTVSFATRGGGDSWSYDVRLEATRKAKVEVSDRVCAVALVDTSEPISHEGLLADRARIGVTLQIDAARVNDVDATDFDVVVTGVTACQRSGSEEETAAYSEMYPDTTACGHLTTERKLRVYGKGAERAFNPKIENGGRRITFDAAPLANIKPGHAYSDAHATTIKIDYHIVDRHNPSRRDTPLRGAHLAHDAAHRGNPTPIHATTFAVRVTCSTPESCHSIAVKQHHLYPHSPPPPGNGTYVIVTDHDHDNDSAWAMFFYFLYFVLFGSLIFCVCYGWWRASRPRMSRADQVTVRRSELNALKRGRDTQRDMPAEESAPLRPPPALRSSARWQGRRPRANIVGYPAEEGKEGTY